MTFSFGFFFEENHRNKMLAQKGSLQKAFEDPSVDVNRLKKCFRGAYVETDAVKRNKEQLEGFEFSSQASHRTDINQYLHIGGKVFPQTILAKPDKLVEWGSIFVDKENYGLIVFGMVYLFHPTEVKQGRHILHNDFWLVMKRLQIKTVNDFYELFPEKPPFQIHGIYTIDERNPNLNNMYTITYIANKMDKESQKTTFTYDGHSLYNIDSKYIPYNHSVSYDQAMVNYRTYETLQLKFDKFFINRAGRLLNGYPSCFSLVYLFLLDVYVNCNGFPEDIVNRDKLPEIMENFLQAINLFRKELLYDQMKICLMASANDASGLFLHTILFIASKFEYLYKDQDITEFLDQKNLTAKYKNYHEILITYGCFNPCWHWGQTKVDELDISNMLMIDYLKPERMPLIKNMPNDLRNMLKDYCFGFNIDYRLEVQKCSDLLNGLMEEPVGLKDIYAKEITKIVNRKTVKIDNSFKLRELGITIIINAFTYMKKIKVSEYIYWDQIINEMHIAYLEHKYQFKDDPAYATEEDYYDGFTEKIQEITRLYDTIYVKIS